MIAHRSRTPMMDGMGYGKLCTHVPLLSNLGGRRHIVDSIQHTTSNGKTNSVTYYYSSKERRSARLERKKRKGKKGKEWVGGDSDTPETCLLDFHREYGPEDVIPELGGNTVPKVKVCKRARVRMKQREREKEREREK